MNLSNNAKVVLEKRIARTKEDGTKETPTDIFTRVARYIARGDENFDGYTEEVGERVFNKFYRLLDSLDFMPNSPCLTGADTDVGNLSACFVLPVEDSMEGIFDAVKNAALIHKTGGGTGFAFSRLRPEGANVSNTGGVSSGPISFMQVFDSATKAIKQGGTRRGANMGILRVDHPDILDFIKAKNDNVSLQNFNISVGITDDFMETLYGNGQFTLKWTDEDKGTEITREVPAKEIWEAIIQSAHATGDPGLVFLDRANRGKANPVPSLGPIESTNPCGEQFLYSYDSCNLGSINLANFVTEDKKVNYADLGDVVFDAVHFLDNVIEMNVFPIPEVEKMTKAVRRIGLGVMGWADMLFKMEIPYDSNDAITLARNVMGFINSEAYKASKYLALSRGSFPVIESSIYVGEEVRNAARTTVAPTGTISIIAGCSSGIEPAFALTYKRSHYLDDDPDKRVELTEVNPVLLHWLMENIKSSDEIQKMLDAIAAGERPNKLPSYFVASHEIDPSWHVKMQGVFQENVDNSVSKTINLPNDATVKDVENAYISAWETGCLGITVYRDGSKEMQVLSHVSENKKEVVNEPRRLNNTRAGIHHKFNVGEFDGYIGVGMFDDGSPGEVFIIGNKTGTTSRGFLDSIGKLISKALQRGEPLSEITSSLIGQKFEPAGFTGNPDIPTATSVVDYVARWLDKRFNTADAVGSKDESKGQVSGDLCPDCDSVIYNVEGCGVCYNCGYSRC